MSTVSLDTMPERRERRHNHGTPYTDEELLDRVRLWKKLTGSPPSKGDWSPGQLRRRIAKAVLRVQALKERLAIYESGDFPNETTVRDRFGSLNSALVQAGFEARSVGREPNVRLPGNRPKPKVGVRHLRLYWGRVQECRQPAVSREELRDALYDLGLAAIAEADAMWAR